MKNIYNHKTTDFLPAKLNNGWRYNLTINQNDAGKKLLSTLSSLYTHSTLKTWRRRLEDGEILINKHSTNNNLVLKLGDVITWERPPWEEPGVPTNFKILFDDGDLFVINKPSGLPVTPGGGFLKHTLTELLNDQARKCKQQESPKPIHRLGRFTSGLILCARKKETREILSKMMRKCSSGKYHLEKKYLALALRNHSLEKDKILAIETPIAMEYHPLMNKVWNTYSHYSFRQKILRASSSVRLIERKKSLDLIEVTIKTGRPHQIRIHLASIGTPLKGDPLYGKYGKLSPFSTPGEGGYLLHAHKLKNLIINDKEYYFEADPPKILKPTNET